MASRRTLDNGPARTLLLSLVLLTVSSARASSTGEYEIKAVFLLKLAEFAHWSDLAFATPAAPIVIGVLGSNALTEQPTRVTGGEHVDDRQLLVRHFARVEDIDVCQILFIGAKEAGRAGALCRRLQGRSILTVGDTDDFTHRRGTIGFRVDDHRLHLAVKLEAVVPARLTISSKLLRLALV